MFRTLTLTGLTILGLAIPLGLTATADAHPPVVVSAPVVYPAPVVTYRPPVVYQAPLVTYRPPVVYSLSPCPYEVMHRHHHHWHCYGTYYSRWDAERAARHLRWDGYDVRIETRY